MHYHSVQTCPNILIRQTELPKCVLVLGFLCAFHLMLIAQLCAPCYGTEVYRSYMHTPNISHQWAQECFFMCLRSVSHFWSKECLPALKHCSLIRAFLLTCMPAHFAYWPKEFLRLVVTFATSGYRSTLLLWTLILCREKKVCRNIGMFQRNTFYLSVLGSIIVSVDGLIGNILVGRHGSLVFHDLALTVGYKLCGRRKV